MGWRSAGAQVDSAASLRATSLSHFAPAVQQPEGSFYPLWLLPALVDAKHGGLPNNRRA